MRPYPRFGANDGNRTHNRSLGSCCFTTKLHSHYSRSLCPGRRDPPLQRLFYHKRAKGQPFLRKLPRSALSGDRSSSPIPALRLSLPTGGRGQSAQKLFDNLCSVLPTGTGQPCHGKHASHTPVPLLAGIKRPSCLRTLRLGSVRVQTRPERVYSAAWTFDCIPISQLGTGFMTGSAQRVSVLPRP